MLKHLKSSTAQEFAENTGNLFAPLGNSTIRGHHIKYLKDNIISSNESSHTNISKTPYYYSWLILYVEHIFWELKLFCFGHDLQSHHLRALYKSSINDFENKLNHLKLYSDNEINESIEIIIEFLIIRVVHNHGGFPNAIPEALNKTLKDYEEYTKKQIVLNLRYYSNPTNFNKIDNKFNFMYEILGRNKISIGM